jgi:hypothetical protein
MGMLADLTQRTNAELEMVRDALARTSDDDPRRAALEEHEIELELLIDDLTHGVTSPAVLEATARLRAEMHVRRRDARPWAERNVPSGDARVLR